MPYMDMLLRRYAEKGITTPEQAEADHREFAAQYRSMGQKAAEYKNPAQAYAQRDNTGAQQEAIEQMRRMIRESKDASRTAE